MNIQWDKPNGMCGQCGSPLNEHMVGGYRIHDGNTDAVSAFYNMTEEMCIDYRNKINKRLRDIRKKKAY